jgi:hypothetical protein
VHDHLDVRVGDQLGHRLQRRARDRVHEVHAAGGGDLGEARDRGVGPLPEELQVDRRPALRARLLHDGGDAGGVADRFQTWHVQLP